MYVWLSDCSQVHTLQLTNRKESLRGLHNTTNNINKTMMTHIVYRGGKHTIAACTVLAITGRRHEYTSHTLCLTHEKSYSIALGNEGFGIFNLAKSGLVKSMCFVLECLSSATFWDSKWRTTLAYFHPQSLTIVYVYKYVHVCTYEHTCICTEHRVTYWRCIFKQDAYDKKYITEDDLVNAVAPLFGQR